MEMLPERKRVELRKVEDLKFGYRKLSHDEKLANMTEDERRRYENSTLGDGLEDRLEDFFVKHQDSNYNNGNF